MYGIVNKVPNVPTYDTGRRRPKTLPAWHDEAEDRSGRGQKGYMLIINMKKGANSILFNSTIDGLSVGSIYEFSAYLANVVRLDNPTETS
ncbi:unnamed protein product, partial [Adineta steineri]